MKTAIVIVIVSALINLIAAIIRHDVDLVIADFNLIIAWLIIANNYNNKEDKQ